MPSIPVGKRKVWCPKCTALLREPQTQIYKCPICATLLLAKGYGVSRSSDNRVHVGNGDTEDIQRMLDGGAKLEKARLISNDQEQKQKENADSEKTRGIEVKEGTLQPEPLGEQTPPASHTPLDPSSQSLSTQLISGAMPKSAALSSESSSGTPPHAKSLHSGEVSPNHESGHHFSDLDSASPSESEAYLDSPLWSSENANTSEVQEASSLKDSLTASSTVDSSSEPMSTVTSIKESNSGKGGLQSMLANDSGMYKEKGSDLDSRIMTKESVGITNSANNALKEDRRSSKESNESLNDNREADSSYTSPIAPIDSGYAGNKSSKDNGTARGSSKDSKGNGGRMETPNVGKFRLFDLSVFGIYNEETYNELRRGTAALSGKLAESGNDGDGLQASRSDEYVPEVVDTAGGDHSPEEEFLGARGDEVVHADLTELHAEKGFSGRGGFSKTCANVSQDDSGGRRLASPGRQDDDDGHGNLEDDSHRDNDALAEARYGDIPSGRELSLDSSTVDISFGDWRLEQVVKPSQQDLEPDSDVESDDEKGRMNSAREEDADSSWGDDAELTFSSTAKGDLKPSVTSSIGKDPEDFSGAKEMTVESQGKISAEPAFPLRTTAMQKFLHRNDKQSAAQVQASPSLIKADPALYEAPYIEHYALPLEKDFEEASDKKPAFILEQEVSITPYVRESDFHTEGLENTLKATGELQSANTPSAHSSPPSTAAPTLTSVQGKNRDKQSVFPEDANPRKDVESVTSLQRNATGQSTDQSDLKIVALSAQKAEYVSQWHANRLGNASGKPVSLRWKGKGSSTQSLSSTEDEGAYGMESEAGSGTEKDPIRDGVVGLLGGPFPEKEGTFGLGQESRDPSGRLSQRAWITNMDVGRQRHASGELATSRRTTRSRPSIERLPNSDQFMGQDRLHVEGRNFIPESFRQTGLDRSSELSSAYLASGYDPNRGRLEQRSNHSYNVMTNHNSDHFSWLQDVPPRYQYSDYMSKMYPSAVGSSTKPYPFPLPAHDAHPVAPLQEQGFPHSAHTHHCVSPACALCVQQQYFMQQPQMIQNTILHPCAACAAQVSAAAYQPMHHDIHEHHVHGLTHANASLKHHDLGALPAQSRQQNRSAAVQHNHPVPLATRTKRYTPLPGRGAAPYVLCKECNQLLHVPEYLPPVSGSVQRLHCGACGKTSKFAIPQAANKWSPPRGYVNAPGLPSLVARNKLPSEQSSSSGVFPAVQSRKGRHLSGQGPQHAWAENRDSSPLNYFGIPPTQSRSKEPRYQPGRPTGIIEAGQAPYGSHVQHTHGDYLPNDTALYNEDYFSSSASSASGTSPRRHFQGSRDNRQAEPLASGTESPHSERMERLEPNSKAGSLHNEPSDAGYSGVNSTRRYSEQVQKLPAAPGSPLIEHFTQDAPDALPSAQHSHGVQNSGDGSKSAAWSLKSDSHYSPPFEAYSQEASTDFSERLYDQDPLSLPVQDGSKGPKSFAGLLKRSIKDIGKGGQGGGSRRKVVVNGHTIPEAAVRRAEEQAGPIHSGTYWYDYQAGFWGVMGGPCLGILMPGIEEFHFSLARDCAGGKTGILVNGRELHARDLEVLAKRSLPTTPGKAYILDISGALFDDVSGQPLKGLGKLAPSIEKRGRGFGMSPATAQS